MPERGRRPRKLVKQSCRHCRGPRQPRRLAGPLIYRRLERGRLRSCGLDHGSAREYRCLGESQQPAQRLHPDWIPIICRPSSTLRLVPGDLPQGHRLSDPPGARPRRPRWFLPMPRLRRRLTVQFEDQFGMPGLNEVAVHMLMTRHAGVGPHIRVLKVAQSCRKFVRVGEPLFSRPGVSTNPSLGRRVTGLARNPLGPIQRRQPTRLRHRRVRRVTRHASGMIGGIRNASRGGNLG